MLSIDDLGIKVGDFHLNGSLPKLPSGIYAVLGPSGAGKSTLLSVIAGFLTPSHGDVIWDNVPITRKPPAQRPVAMLFQDNNLFPHLTIQRNLALALTSRGRLTKDHTAAIADALSRVGLSGLDHRKPAELSGGQQSRAALARVLLQNKPIVLLDEPFAALGPALKTEMLDLVAELATERRALVLMVTHDPSDALRIAPHTIVVADGHINQPQPTAELLNNPPPTLAAYLGQK